MPFATLPAAHLSWTQVTLDPGQAFVHYNIYVDDVRVATIDDIATTTFVYEEAKPGVLHEYGVSWTANTAGTVLESVPTTINGSLTFKSGFIHAVDDPTVYGEFPMSQISVQRDQDLEYARARGRSAPTAFISELEAHTLEIEVLPALLSEPEFWNMLKTLQTRQRTLGSVLCVRAGHITGERYFVNLDPIRREDQNNIAHPKVNAHEVFYQEEV